ncbi:MAG: LuxR C-terminal-related transcriptional regulator, partial [Gemmatimonadaceae bacterium]
GGQGAAIRRWKGGAGGIENFDLEVRIRDGGRLWVNVSTIVFDNKRTKRRLFIRLARDISQRRQQEEVLGRMVEVARQVVSLDPSTGHAPVDTLSGQERRILILLADGTSTATVAEKLKISPQTLRNHLHHINRRLRTRNRLEAVTHAQAVRGGGTRRRYACTCEFNGHTSDKVE